MVINKIHNIDCMEMMSNMKDLSVNMTITDIPFGNVTKKGEERAKYRGQLRKIDKGKADEVTFNLHDFLDEVSRITNGSIYIFCGIEQVSEIYTYYENHKDFMVRQCAWKKTNPSPSNGQHMWLYTMENCIFAKRRKTKFNANCKPSVWDYPVMRGKVHPTQKPLELFKFLIESSTDEGDIVFDPCIGSGTTALASKELNRNYLGCELDVDYYNIALERIGDVND